MSKIQNFGHHQSAPRVCVLQKAFLGDILLTTPLIQLLLNKACDVTVLTHPAGKALLNHVFFKVGENLKFIELGKPHPFFLRPLRTFSVLRKYWKHFDVSLAIQRGFECSVLARGFSKLWSIGFESAEGSFLLHVTYPRHEGTHEVEKNHSLLQSLWGDEPVLEPGWARQSSYAGHDLSRWGVQSRYGIIHPGTKWVTKGWPFPRYIDLLRQLARSPLQWILTGDEIDREKWEGLQGGLPVPALNLMGKLTLSEYMQLCAGAQIVVGNDSFSTHVASAYNVPTLTIFGSTVPEFGFGPLSTWHEVVEHKDLACRPCGIHGYARCPQTHFRCMQDISVHQVVFAAKSLLTKVDVHV